MPSTNLSALEIKTMSELNEHFSIDGNESLSKDNFSHPVKPYDLYKSDAKCQYLKRSTNCGKEHQRGYVVKTKNGKYVLIGHCCAEKHLGIEDKEIKNSFSQLRKAEDIQIRTARAVRYLSSRDAISDDLNELSEGAEELYDSANRIVQFLPIEVVRALHDRFKRRDFKILWEYSRVKKVTDEDGKSKTVTTWYPLEFPSLKGLGDWLQPRGSSLQPKIDSMRNDLEELPRQTHLEQADLKKAESVIKGLKDIDAMKAEILRQNKLIKEFCEKDNLMLLVQLSRNHELRAEIVNSVFAILRESLPTQPSAIVQNIDSGLRKKHNASGLRLAA